MGVAGVAAAGGAVGSAVGRSGAANVIAARKPTTRQPVEPSIRTMPRRTIF